MTRTQAGRRVANSSRASVPCLPCQREMETCLEPKTARCQSRECPIARGATARSRDRHVLEHLSSWIIAHCTFEKPFVGTGSGQRGYAGLPQRASVWSLTTPISGRTCLYQSIQALVWLKTGHPARGTWNEPRQPTTERERRRSCSFRFTTR